MIHKPVLLGESIENLNLEPGMTVVDGTLGAGGHTLAILESILPGGKLVSIDRDKQAVEEFEKKLVKGISIAKKELIKAVRPALVNNNKNNDRAFFQITKTGNRKSKIVGYWCGAIANYADVKNVINEQGLKKIDAILVDLGFSSDQIENAQRGFSFLRNGPLDMRYSPLTQKKTAATIVNKYSEAELARILKIYGEEKFARSIARGIVIARKSGEISETGELVEIISKAVPAKYKKGKIHYATKTFQALRIETNDELENLEKFLNQATEVLASKGTLAVISFHSMEDRIVKNFFRAESQDCLCPPKFPKCVCSHKSRLKIITKKPITASESEIKENPRARSAKLRVAQKK